MKFANFLKIRLIFNICYCFWMFVNKLFTYPRVHISKNKRCFNMKSSTYYFYMKTKILADFQICDSVPLIFNLPAFWKLIWCSVMNVLLVTCSYFRVRFFAGHMSWLEPFLIIVVILLLKHFATLKYVKYNNSWGPQRRPYRLIYILTAFFYVAEFVWLSK